MTIDKDLTKDQSNNPDTRSGSDDLQPASTSVNAGARSNPTTQLLVSKKRSKCYAS